MAGGAAGGKCENQLGDDVIGATALRRMKAGQRQPGRCRTAHRQDCRCFPLRYFHRHERAVAERIAEVATAGELVIQIAREPIARDEHVRFAAETPPQGGMRPIAGTSGDQ